MTNRRSVFQALASWLLAPFAARAKAPAPPSPSPKEILFDVYYLKVFGWRGQQREEIIICLRLHGENYAFEFPASLNPAHRPPGLTTMKIHRDGRLMTLCSAKSDPTWRPGIPAEPGSNPSISE